MKCVRRIPCLLIFGTGFTLLGGFSTFDSGLSLWWGLTVGACIGVFFGLVFGGAKCKWLDVIYGPEDTAGDESPDTVSANGSLPNGNGSGEVEYPGTGRF
jgi:hypothetical protein